MLYVIVKLNLEGGMRPAVANPPPNEPQAAPNRVRLDDHLDAFAQLAPAPDEAFQPPPRRGGATRISRFTVGVSSYALPNRDRPAQVYLDEPSARAAATQLAEMNPGEQYGLFVLGDIFETMEQPTPPVIQKVFTEQGELRVKSE